MKEQFWINKWQKNEIRFHQESYHPNLIKFWKEFTADNTGAVFVPLCGKTLDMIFFLQQGHQVYGAELSPLAIKSFFTENQLDYHLNNNCYSSKMLSLYCGDIFKLKSEHFKEVSFIYDRAALVALPHEMRKRYTKWLYQSFPKASIFLETSEFDNAEVGPPFSIRSEMINDYYGESYHIVEKQILTPKFENVKVHKGKISKMSLRTSFLKPKETLKLN